MNYSDVGQTFIEELKQYISNDKDLISFLENTLNIGRQSVYRRLRGEIPFTFDEIVAISLALGISVDEIIGKHHQKGTFLELYLEKDLDKIYYSFGLDSLDLVRKMSKSNESGLMTVTNRLPAAFTMDFYYLSRFKYYKAVHQQQNQISDLPYSQVDLSSELKEILKKIRYYYKFIKDTSIILDNNSFLALIKEITYFYKRNLITHEELQNLKSELYEVLDKFEAILINGDNGSGGKFSVYVSILNIETNYSYFHYDGNEIIKFWPNAEIPMVIHDSRVSLIEKEWLGAAKKYSVLITQSNEAQRSEYVSKQKGYIDSLGEELILV